MKIKTRLIPNEGLFHVITAYIFGSLGVTVEDIYFLEPNPDPGEEGPERGVRVEVRLIERLPRTGSIYSAYPVHLQTAIWRADLLESVAAGPGARDRMHFHPMMADDEPGDRVFDPAIPADPLGWLAERLADIEPIVAAKVTGSELAALADDCTQVRWATARIVDAARDAIARVHCGVHAA